MNFHPHLLYIAKEFSSCVLLTSFIYFNNIKMLQIFDTYIISIGTKFFFFFEHMLMWSLIEINSKFLQNIKTIYLRIFLLYIMVSVLGKKSPYLTKKIIILNSINFPKVCLQNLARIEILRYCWFSIEVSAK